MKTLGALVVVKLGLNNDASGFTPQELARSRTPRSSGERMSWLLVKGSDERLSGVIIIPVGV